jgi:CheY-like chemotaxis protein
MPAILLIGEDEFLLETRAAVLRSTGAEMVCADVSSATAMLERKNFDLAVLCHSVPGPVCQTVIEIIRQSWPSTRILLISALRHWELDGAVEGVEVCTPDPERLIERTIELLGRRKPGPVLTLVRDSSARQVAGR